MKLMMASGIPLVSLAVLLALAGLLAMVGASDTCVAEKIESSRHLNFSLILSTCSFSMMNLRSTCALSS